MKSAEHLTRLTEEHLEVAKQIIKRNIIKPNCKLCYGRGYVGLTPANQTIPCVKCTNSKQIYIEWKAYVITNPELHGMYTELLKQDMEEHPDGKGKSLQQCSEYSTARS